MRTAIFFFLFTWAGMSSAFGQWAVVDAVNLQQNVTNYAVMVEQLSRQATQIANEVRQIQQLETQLKRMGDMASVKTIVGFSEFHADLELPTKAQAWSDILTQVDGRGLFGDILSAAGGGLAGGTESAIRGGGSPRTTATAINGFSGFYSGGLMRRHAVASERAATAQKQNADASEEFASVFTEYAAKQRRNNSGFDKQPHHHDPNNAAIEIESHDKSKS